MSALSLISAALSLLRLVVGYFRDRRLIEAGAAASVMKNLVEASNEIERASATREAARRYNELNPDRVRDDDGFKRPD